MQRGRSFNTLGELEIPETALEELLVNALVHRDYFTSASVRVMVFADRVEIVSPGHLPDSLSPEDIRRGKTIRRNPTLTEHASHILPYRGMGSGIPRALEAWPQIDLVDDLAGNQFSAVVWRPESEWQHTGEDAGEVTGEVMRLFAVIQGEMKRADIQAALGLRHEDHFRETYLRPALEVGAIEMTIPDKPRSRFQKYRLTSAGKAWLLQNKK